jgi:predicted TIM-barrel fold metal-dependent hydrolase
MKVIDLELDLPPSIDDIVSRLKDYLFHSTEKGMANYGNIFGKQRAQALDFTPEELQSMKKDMTQIEVEKVLIARAKKAQVTLRQFVKQMDEAGIEWGAVFAGDSDKTAAVVKQFPKRFIGTANINPLDGMKAVRELERSVKELGIKCFYASPFRYGIRANDRRFYPLYAKAVELDIPVFIYTTMTYRTDIPMDIGRPIYVDDVAMDFPEMRIVAGLGGWPWVPEVIGLARRHQNLYISTAAHRPKYFATPGSGWEMLMQFGNTLLQDKIVFASSWFTYSLPIKQVVEEMLALPLKDSVKEKWMYHNARRLFRLE